MYDLSDLRNEFINLQFLSKLKNSFRFNYRKESLRVDWINKNKQTWENYISKFSSEEEFLFYLLNPNETDEKCCPICGKKLSFEQIKRNRKSCSKECLYKLSHNDDWRNKTKLNWQNKTQEEKDEIKNRLESVMMEKYGVKHNWCKGELRDKEKQTWMKKYGVDHPLKSKEIKDKIKNVKFERYGDEYYTNREKAKKTCEEINAYNVVSKKNKLAWQNKTQEDINERTEKTRKTNLEKYGTISPWYHNEEIANKRKQTCLKKYGCEHWSNSEIVKEKKKQTALKNYGYESHMKSKDFIEKFKQNNLEKYGYEWCSQSPEFQSKIRKIYDYDNLKFDSKYELYFYIYNKEILKNEIKRDKIFEFEFENEKHFYYCDFYINDEFIEIKGNHLIRNGRLYFPYRNEENWEYHQRLWDAKSKCMQKHNVKIILTDSNEMKEIIEKVDDKFTKDYVELFNIHKEFPYPNDKLSDTSDLGLIHHFHKSIYEAHRKDKPSPIEGWYNKSLVKEVALNRLKFIGFCTPANIIQGFNVTLKAPKVSTFSPYIAKDLIMKYLVNTETIVDPFSGFSGRLLGCENCNKKYYGFDINEKHVNESNEIIKFRDYNNSIIQVRDILSEFPIKSYDALFTCPPYGGKEHWNKDNNEVEKSCDEWIDICLRKFNCKKYLFIVDKTEKYKEFIVETLSKKSHFGERKEFIVLINGD